MRSSCSRTFVLYRYHLCGTKPICVHELFKVYFHFVSRFTAGRHYIPTITSVIPLNAIPITHASVHNYSSHYPPAPRMVKKFKKSKNSTDDQFRPTLIVSLWTAKSCWTKEMTAFLMGNDGFCDSKVEFYARYTIAPTAQNCMVHCTYSAQCAPMASRSTFWL